MDPRHEKKDIWRFEYKYHLSLPRYHQFRSALIPYVELDDHCRHKPDHAYLVRSLYFDSFHYKAYYEKMEGTYGRTKYRLRTYSATPGAKPDIRVELKLRKGSALEKYSTFASYHHYRQFMKYRHWCDEDAPVLIEFQRQVHLHALRPKVLVQYYREGFRAKETGELRITFDRQVSSCRSDTLFPTAPFFRQHHPHTVVLEIKCRTRRPAWLSRLISRYELRYIANSKYTQGVEAARPELISPYLSSHLQTQGPLV